MTPSARGLIIVLALLPGAACDDGGGSGGVDASGGAPTCTVTGTAVASVANRTITGTGAVQCNASATIQVETCVQWNPNGTYADIMCQSGTMSGVMQQQVQNVSSCGIATGRMYRTRVNATINGVALTEVLSSVVSCQ